MLPAEFPMRTQIFAFLSFILLISACNTTPLPPTEKQSEFANELVGQRGIIKTEWYNRLSLQVTVDLNSLGINPTMQAQLLADEIAAAGHAYTGESICVNIYYGYLNKLASSCSYD